MQLYLFGLGCGGCARNVAKAIKAIDPTALVTSDPISPIMQVETSASREQIQLALRDAGFPQPLQ